MKKDSNPKKTKGLVFIGSRANYGRLYMVMKEMLKHEHWLEFKIFLASSGTYLDLGEFTEYIGYIVDGLMYKDTPANIPFTTDIVSQHASNYLNHHETDFCIIHGDRYECLGMATACFFNDVPVVHTEGGETSGSYDDTIRRLITQLATHHFVTTSESQIKVYNATFGVVKGGIHNVGSPTIDMVFNILERRMIESPTQYAVVLYNPLVGEDYQELLRAIRILADKIKITWINPNVDPGSKDLIYKIKARNKIEFIKDLTPEAYIKLLDRAMILIGNTSSGIKEGAAIGIPYVMIGDRQKGREVSSNVMPTDMECNSIVQQAERFLGADQCKITYDGKFGNGLASEKILKVLKEVF